jgi:hypothetical protein
MLKLSRKGLFLQARRRAIIAHLVKKAKNFPRLITPLCKRALKRDQKIGHHSETFSMRQVLILPRLMRLYCR